MSAMYSKFTHARSSARVVEALWLIAALVVPLIFNPLGHNAFELPKVLLLRALVLLMAVVALLQNGVTRHQLHRPSTPLIWPTLIFGLALILATILSVNPHASLWGSYDRQQGLIILGAYLVLFLITATHLRRRDQIERLWSVLVWGSAPIIAYGLLQAARLDPLNWHSDAASPVLSTLGRSNFFGSYLVLILPLTTARLLLAPRRKIYFVLLATQVACLAFTQARGAWLGLGAAMLVFALARIVITRMRRVAAVMLIVIALIAGFVFVLNIPVTSGSTAARLAIWRSTLPLIATHPLTGYGPETMRTVFAQVFPPELIYYQGRHVAVDRAHNVWLDLGMSAGAIGVVAFGALLLGVGRLIWKGQRADHDRWHQVMWAALAVSIIGHLIDLQFGFDLTGSAVIFWLILAITAAMGRGLSEEMDWHKPISLRMVVPPLLASLLLIGLISLYPLLADVAYQDSLSSAAPIGERREAAMQAVRLWPIEPQYHIGLASILMQGGDFADAEAQLLAADRLSPNDPPVWSTMGELYAQWATVEPSRYAQAETACRHALALAPNMATYHAALGLVLARRGELQQGLALLERAVALDATDGVAYQYLAEIYLAVGRRDEADQARREAARWSP